jgi:hypothetical protein
MGDMYAGLFFSVDGEVLNYSSGIVATAPTGDRSRGFSTGRPTVDWTNTISRSFGDLHLDDRPAHLSGGLTNRLQPKRHVSVQQPFLRSWLAFQPVNLSRRMNMKVEKAIVTGLILSLALSSAPLLVHGQGVGAGAGVGGGVHGGAQNQGRGGANARVQAPGANVGVNTDANAKTRGPAVSSPSSDVASRIEANSKLAARLQPMLPAGTSVKQAAAGFRNQGQFIAALHVSRNLEIPFDQLKGKMTGEPSMSLGAAIHAVRPDINEDKANAEAKKAETEAKQTEKK